MMREERNDGRRGDMMEGGGHDGRRGDMMEGKRDDGRRGHDGRRRKRGEHDGGRGA